MRCFEILGRHRASSGSTSPTSTWTPRCPSDGYAKVRDIMEDVQPDTVLTFGPDGMTGHVAHMSVTRVGHAGASRRSAARARRSTTPPTRRSGPTSSCRSTTGSTSSGPGRLPSRRATSSSIDFPLAARPARAQAAGDRGAREPGRRHGRGVRRGHLPAGHEGRVVPAGRGEGTRDGRAPAAGHRPRLGPGARARVRRSGRRTCGRSSSSGCRTCRSPRRWTAKEVHERGRARRPRRADARRRRSSPTCTTWSSSGPSCLGPSALHGLRLRRGHGARRRRRPARRRAQHERRRVAALARRHRDRAAPHAVVRDRAVRAARGCGRARSPSGGAMANFVALKAARDHRAGWDVRPRAWRGTRRSRCTCPPRRTSSARAAPTCSGSGPTACGRSRSTTTTGCASTCCGPRSRPIARPGAVPFAVVATRRDGRDRRRRPARRRSPTSAPQKGCGSTSTAPTAGPARARRRPPPAVRGDRARRLDRVRPAQVAVHAARRRLRAGAATWRTWPESFDADASYIVQDKEYTQHGLDLGRHGPQFSPELLGAEGVGLAARARASGVRAPHLARRRAGPIPGRARAEERAEFELAAPVGLSICCFRYVPPDLPDGDGRATRTWTTSTSA